MKYNDVIERLQNLTLSKINTTEIAEILHIPVRTLYTRSYRNSEVTPIELKKLEDAFNVNLFNSDTLKNEHVLFNEDVIKIPYWEGLPDELKHPEYSYVIAQKTSIEQAWQLEADNLRIVPMVGDKMTDYWYRINDGDVLIIDISHNHIRGNGVYFATSQNNTRFWIREMQALINNDTQIKGFAPSGETTKIFTPQQLQEVNFKVIGKVIKNVSFRL